MVTVRNAASGPVMACGRLLYPGETCVLTSSSLDALNAEYGAGTLVVVGQAGAAEAGAKQQEEAAASGKKGRK